MQDYIWLIMTIGLASFFYAIRIWDKEDYKTKWELIRKLIYGMGGSAFTTLVVYSLCKHNGLDELASLAIGGACGHLGAESFVALLQKFIDKKI